MSDFLGAALGVLLAVVFPILKGYVQKEFGTTAAPGLPVWFKKYALLLVFCLASALLVMGIFRSVKPDLEISFWVALMLGFGYESTIEKFLAKPLV
jgi:hypothetical protein